MKSIEFKPIGISTDCLTTYDLLEFTMMGMHILESCKIMPLWWNRFRAWRCSDRHWLAQILLDSMVIPPTAAH